MYVDRKRVFIDSLKWDIPHEGGREIDQYDTAQADYLILADRLTGEHRASVRLLPTTGPHILGEVFPYLCDGAVPRGLHIMEITRFVLSPDVRRREKQATRNMLGRAMIEFGQSQGVEQFTAVCEMGFLSQLLASGWQIEPLGMPQVVAGSTIGAVLIHLDQSSLGRTSDAWQYAAPVLTTDREITNLAA
ncbi:MAG: acyl-homoserine-lactone synthase [Novosphingobium sp.]